MQIEMATEGAVKCPGIVLLGPSAREAAVRLEQRSEVCLGSTLPLLSYAKHCVLALCPRQIKRKRGSFSNKLKQAT